MHIKYPARKYFTPLATLGNGEMFTLGDAAVQIIYARGWSFGTVTPQVDFPCVLTAIVASAEPDQVGLIVPMRPDTDVMRVRRTNQERFETIDNE